MALIESVSRHILKIASFLTDGFQFVVCFLTNFTAEPTDDILMKIDATMEATQCINPHSAVFLKDATLLTQPAAGLSTSCLERRMPCKCCALEWLHNTLLCSAGLTELYDSLKKHFGY